MNHRAFSSRLCFALAFICACVCGRVGATEPIWYPITPGTNSGTPLDIQVLPQRTAYALEIEVRVPGVFVHSIIAADEGRYESLDVPGMGAGAAEIGLPEMPSKGVFVEVPAGVQVTAEIKSRDEILLADDFQIRPRQPTVIGEIKPPASLEKNLKAYESTERFPSKLISVSKPGVIRGRHVVRLHVSPLQYVPAAGEVYANRTIHIVMRYSRSDLPAHSTPISSTPEWNRLMEPFILNAQPQAVDAGVQELRTTTGADYLVIVPDAFETAIQPLVEWKHKKGWKTHITTLSEIGQDPDAEDIWQEINDAYTTWNPAPTYVLLVGDHDNLPPFIRTEAAWNPILTYATDHPYALMDVNDDYFAPDLVVSRITAHSAQETSDVVQKLLDYEIIEAQNPPEQWYEHFCTATYFDPMSTLGYEHIAASTFMETIAYIDSFLSEAIAGPNMVSHTAWYNDVGPFPQYRYGGYPYPHKPAIPDIVPLSVTQRWSSNMGFAQAFLIDAINNGVSLAVYYEHGSPTGWGYPPFHCVNVVNNLQNGHKTPVVLSISCLTGRFNYDNGDCFAEALLEAPANGAVGVIASTEVAGWYHTDLLAHGIMDCFWPNYDLSTQHSDPDFPISSRPAEALLYGQHYAETYTDPQKTGAPLLGMNLPTLVTRKCKFGRPFLRPLRRRGCSIRSRPRTTCWYGQNMRTILISQGCVAAFPIHLMRARPSALLPTLWGLPPLKYPKDSALI